MTDWRSPKRGAPAGAKSKADRKGEAEDAVAAFLAKGGAIKQMPAVKATSVACATCGYAGIIGLSEGKKGRCPKCRAVL